MKKQDCIYYEMVIDYIYEIGLDGEPIPKPILVDEVCHCKEKGGPLHYNEYECKDCPFNKKEEKKDERN